MRRLRMLMRPVGAATLAAMFLAVSGCSRTDAQHRLPLIVTVAPSVKVPSVRSAASAPQSAASAPAAAVPALIAHVRWTSTSKGRQLQIFPTAAGRTDSAPDGLALAWKQVLTDAPDADSPGMFDQFECHWQFARLVEPNKPSWDLEPWRPAVGYQATVTAMCNPGGAEG